MPLPDGTPAPLGDPALASNLLSGFDEKMTLESRDGPLPPTKSTETPPKTDPDPGKVATPPPAPEKPVAPPKDAPTAPLRIDLKAVPAELRTPPLAPGTPPAPPAPPAPATSDPEVELDALDKAHPGAVNAQVRLIVKGLKERAAKAEAAAQARASGQPAAEVKIEDNPIVKELQEKVVKYEDRLGRLDLQNHPQYQANLVKPELDLVAQGREYLKAVDAEEGLLDKLLTKSVADRIKIIDEEAGPAKAMLIPLLSQIDKIREARAIVDAKWKENAERWNSQTRMQQAQLIEANRQALYQQALAVRAQEGDTLLRELPGQEDWNKSVGTIKEMAKAYFFTDKADLQAQAFVKAAQFDVLQDLYRQQNALVQELQAEIQAMTVATPGIRSERSSSPAPVPTAPVDSQDAGAAAADILRGILPR